MKYKYKHHLDIDLSKSIFTELYLQECGWEDCKPGYSVGPVTRDFYFIQFNTIGGGCLLKEAERYPLIAGDIFVTFPNETVTYYTDDAKPWTCYWIGIKGSAAEKILTGASITKQNPIIHVTKSSDDITDGVKKLYLSSSTIGNESIQSFSQMIQLLSSLFGEQSESGIPEPFESFKAKYVSNAVTYIQENYSKDISVEQIADYVGVNRSYLYNIFKEYFDTGPKEYLQKIRLKKVCALLSETDMPINHIASTTGFSSSAHLNVVFRNAFEMTPGNYRSNNRKES